MSKKQRFSDVRYVVGVIIAVSVLAWFAASLSSDDPRSNVNSMDVSALQPVSDEQLRLQRRSMMYNTMKSADGKIVRVKSGLSGAGSENPAGNSSAQRSAGSSEGSTFSLNICFAPALKHGNILLLSSNRTFTFCLQGPKPEMVQPPRPGGLPIRAGK